MSGLSSVAHTDTHDTHTHTLHETTMPQNGLLLAAVLVVALAGTLTHAQVCGNVCAVVLVCLCRSALYCGCANVPPINSRTQHTVPGEHNVCGVLLGQQVQPRVHTSASGFLHRHDSGQLRRLLHLQRGPLGVCVCVCGVRACFPQGPKKFVLFMVCVCVRYRWQRPSTLVCKTVSSVFAETGPTSEFAICLRY